VSIIALITSYARIHFHRYLSKIDYANLLYFDTESVYMVYKKGAPDPFETCTLITGHFQLEHAGLKECSERRSTAAQTLRLRWFSGSAYV